MNLIILHGNGLVAQLNKIKVVKKQFATNEIREFNGKEVDFEKITAETLTPNLFSSGQLVILENFKESEDPTVFGQNPDLTVIFKFNKTLPPTSQILKKAKNLNAQIICFTEEQERSIFPYLDMLAEKNPKALLEQEKLLNAYGGQYILTMIFYLLRRLVMRPKKLPEFVLKKQMMQKRNFSKEEVGHFYSETILADFKIKTGKIDEKTALLNLTSKFLAHH